MNLADYARKMNASEEAVQDQINNEQLITASDADGRLRILWPPNCSVEDAPEVGQFQFSTTFSQTAIAQVAIDDDSDSEEAQTALLALANTLGDPSEVRRRAISLLRENVFLLRWNLFESFLRHALRELYRTNLAVFTTGKRGTTPNTLKDLFDDSEGFSSMEALRENLISREIEKAERDTSIHGLLNSLKSDFKLDEDPYLASYVLHGESRTSSYNKLLEIKHVRNALVHQGGLVEAKTIDQFPGIPHADSRLSLSDDYCIESELIFKSTAYRVNQSILRTAIGSKVESINSKSG